MLTRLWTLQYSRPLLLATGATPNLAMSFWKDPGRISGDMPSSIEARRVPTCFGEDGPAPIELAFARIWRTRSFVTPSRAAISHSRSPSFLRATT